VCKASRQQTNSSSTKDESVGRDSLLGSDNITKQQHDHRRVSVVFVCCYCVGGLI
jgi:hypothetical protein